MAGIEAAGDIVAIGAESRTAERRSSPTTLNTTQAAANAWQHRASIGASDSWLNDLVGLENGAFAPVSGATAAAVLASILAVLVAYVYAGRACLEGRPLYSLSYVPIYPPS
jgi:hypothetical protein